MRADKWPELDPVGLGAVVRTLHAAGSREAFGGLRARGDVLG